MKSEKTLTDEQLGTIAFRYNPRARKYIIRIKPDKVAVTVPRGGSFAYAESFFKKNREGVIKVLEKVKARETARKESSTAAVNRPSDSQLASQAKLLLPPRLAELARECGFSYVKVQTRKSKTRWGSCSSKKTISLSFYLLLLPPHLIDYVLLHELCHTVHMNHSPAFWALLDQHTGGKSKFLRKELRAYHIPG
ncbi:hypothetical protein SAMD00024442_10_49 [Candidatus Symbiothrix dinenymphae]|nr:hypothetical protein SAMD00024442_10_49 [Candidatus Symbiothrix dinenymphae]